MESLLTADVWISLTTLTLMEVVLGIDNIVFISILVGRLPPARQPKIQRLGISLALVFRLGLLGGITWIMGLTAPLFVVWAHAVSGRDLILLAGGLFLMAKATHEIYDKLEGDLQDQHGVAVAAPAAGWIVVQILLLDMVFSLDSVITAVGMASQLWIMVAAMVIAVGVMLVSASAINGFVHRHPSVKILALAFLLLIGSMLVAEGTGQHVGKGYIYFAMAFSLAVELLNMRYRRRQRPVVLHERFE